MGVKNTIFSCNQVCFSGSSTVNGASYVTTCCQSDNCNLPNRAALILPLKWIIALFNWIIALFMT